MFSYDKKSFTNKEMKNETKAMSVRMISKQNNKLIILLVVNEAVLVDHET